MNIAPFIRENRRTVALALGIVVIIIIYLVIQPEEQPDTSANISLQAHISAETDTDKDSIPDWLEDISGTDYLDITDFPYQEDLARARNVDVDDLLYAGPGEFAEDVFLRLITDRGEVTDEEKDRFVDDVSDYFTAKSEELGVPSVRLSINDEVSRSEVLAGFTEAMTYENQSILIEELIFEVFGDNRDLLPVATEFKEKCDNAIDTIPREVPRDVYDSYFTVLERITYACEALAVALSDNTVEGFFHALRLLSLGRLFEGVSGITNSLETQEIYGALREHVTNINTLLGEGGS